MIVNLINFFISFSMGFEIRFLNIKNKVRALMYRDKYSRKLIIYYKYRGKRKRFIFFNPKKYIKIGKYRINTYTLRYKNTKSKVYHVHTLLKALKFHPNMISVTIYQPIFYWKNQKRRIKSLILEYNFPSIIWFERRNFVGKFGKLKVFRSYFYKWDFLVYYYLKSKEPLAVYLIKDKKNKREYLIDVENNICWNLNYVYPVRCNIEIY